MRLCVCVCDEGNWLSSRSDFRKDPRGSAFLAFLLVDHLRKDLFYVVTVSRYTTIESYRVVDRPQEATIGKGGGARAEGLETLYLCRAT